MKVAFLSSPFGTPRHRCHHPREQLQRQGIEAVVLDGAAPPLAGYTHAVLNRVPLSPALLESIAAAEAAHTRVLFDVDDLLFDADVVGELEFVKARPAADQLRLREAVTGIALTIDRCGAGLCATPALRRELQARGCRARVALNGVSDEMVLLSETAAANRRRSSREVRIGLFAGHPGHGFNLAVVEDAVDAVLRRHAEARLVLLGLEPPPRLRAWLDRIECIPFMDWRDLPPQLAGLDVCMAPLADNRFNGCKSDLKLLETALVRVPLVASPVGQLGETIRHGINGLLASDTEAWIEALSSLVQQPDRRVELAAAAHEQVRRERTSAALGPRLIEALQDAGGPLESPA